MDSAKQPGNPPKKYINAISRNVHKDYWIMNNRWLNKS